MDTAVAEPTTTPAPETSSPAPSSAPDTSTTQTAVSTPAVAERPTNIRDLAKTLADLDAKSSATPPETKTAAQPGGPTTQAAATTPTAGAVPSQPGPIPFDKHSQILDNARTKAANEVRAQYGNLPPQKLQEFAGIANRMVSDPIGFLNEYAAQLANHPIYGPQLRSSAGRTLASAPAARPEPDVQVVNAQGQVVSMTYSAERLAEVQKWDREQQANEFKQMISPLVQDREQRIQQEQVAAVQREVHTAADRGLTQIDRILDGRSAELGPHVAQLMADRPDLDPVEAALEIRAQMIVPKVQEAAAAQVLDSQLKKANGNTANGRGAVATPTRPKNRAELAKMLEQLEA